MLGCLANKALICRYQICKLVLFLRTIGNGKGTMDLCYFHI